jgi:hypothetical protein
MCVMGQNFDALPLEVRAQHYRFMAEEALRASGNAQNEASRTDFLSIARGWHMLALQVEMTLSKHGLSENRQSDSWFNF